VVVIKIVEEIGPAFGRIAQGFRSNGKIKQIAETKANSAVFHFQVFWEYLTE